MINKPPEMPKTLPKIIEDQKAAIIRAGALDLDPAAISALTGQAKQEAEAGKYLAELARHSSPEEIFGTMARPELVGEADADVMLHQRIGKIDLLDGSGDPVLGLDNKPLKVWAGDPEGHRRGGEALVHEKRNRDLFGKNFADVRPVDATLPAGGEREQLKAAIRDEVAEQLSRTARFKKYAKDTTGNFTPEFLEEVDAMLNDENYLAIAVTRHNEVLNGPISEDKVTALRAEAEQLKAVVDAKDGVRQAAQDELGQAKTDRDNIGKGGPLDLTTQITTQEGVVVGYDRAVLEASKNDAERRLALARNAKNTGDELVAQTDLDQANRQLSKLEVEDDKLKELKDRKKNIHSIVDEATGKLNEASTKLSEAQKAQAAKLIEVATEELAFNASQDKIVQDLKEVWGVAGERYQEGKYSSLEGLFETFKNKRLQEIGEGLSEEEQMYVDAVAWHVGVDDVPGHRYVDVKDGVIRKGKLKWKKDAIERDWQTLLRLRNFDPNNPTGTDTIGGSDGLAIKMMTSTELPPGLQVTGADLIKVQAMLDPKSDEYNPNFAEKVSGLIVNNLVHAKIQAEGLGGLKRNFTEGNLRQLTADVLPHTPWGKKMLADGEKIEGIRDLMEKHGKKDVLGLLTDPKVAIPVYLLMALFLGPVGVWGTVMLAGVLKNRGQSKQVEHPVQNDNNLNANPVVQTETTGTPVVTAPVVTAPVVTAPVGP